MTTMIDLDQVRFFCDACGDELELAYRQPGELPDRYMLKPCEKCGEESYDRGAEEKDRELSDPHEQELIDEYDRGYENGQRAGYDEGYQEGFSEGEASVSD